MRYVPYNPGQVVHLSTIVGDTMVVSFATDGDGNVGCGNRHHSSGGGAEGQLPLPEANAALPLQPIIVLTQRSDGSLRRYVFEIETVNDPTTADGTDGVFYSVQFTYPAEEAAEPRKPVRMQRRRGSRS